MRITYEENELLIQIVEMLSENYEGNRERIMLAKLADKFKIYKDYKIGIRLNKDQKKRCLDLIREASRIVDEYRGLKGDMSLINEYDRLKKESSAVSDAIGDIEGQLRADVDIAKKQLDIILDRIKEDLIENEGAKSLSEADRKAKVDPRYESALEDYREFTKMTNVMRNKLNTMKDIHDDIRQSVSTARNSIIKEGYNQ